MGQRLPREPLRVRVGADAEPRRSEAVDAQGPRGPGHRAGRPRPLQAPRADDADDGSRAEARPGLRADLQALLREPRPARGGVRQGLVQAAAPRHGARLALPRPVGPGGAAVAGPRPRGRPRADRRRPTSLRSRRRSSPRGCRSRGSSPPPGPRRPRSAAPTSAAAPTGRGSGSRRRRTGSANEPAELAVRAADARADPAGLQRLAVGRQAGLAGRPDRPRRLRRRRAGREERRARRLRPVHPGAHRRLAGADRRGVLRRARADRRRLPQLLPPGRAAPAGARAARARLHAEADRSRDDGR